MIRNDTKQVIKFICWFIALVIFVYLASVFIFYQAGKPRMNNERRMTQIAQEKTPITSISHYYHLDRGVNSYALKGHSKNDQTYYFIYLLHSKKAYLYPNNKGVSEDKVVQKFKYTHPEARFKALNLGWYQGQAVWEVTFQNKEGQDGFTVYRFRNGKLLNEVANL